MVLKTKSIRAPITDDDGQRICVMRKYNPEKHPEYQSIDDHCAWLAPSNDLLEDYQKRIKECKDIEYVWSEFYVARFTEEVLATHQGSLIPLAHQAKLENITLLCYEETPEYCHRRLLALACKMYQPELAIKLE
ncbi:DUF488 domain-containing protein [Candidatus Woesearchaeota archaeon]|nr:DUF488 domain-containing protein [Candidatus Woesearchaeota archaeon]